MKKFYAKLISDIKIFLSRGNISEDRPHQIDSIKHIDQRSNTKDFLINTSAGERRAGARKTV